MSRGPDLQLAEEGQLAAAMTPLGSDATVVDLLDRVLERGVTITGDVALSVAGIDLVSLGLRVVLTSVDANRESSP